MKKKLLFCILLVLALLTLTAAAACAETFITLGSFPAGGELDLSIGWTNSEGELFVDDLPQGLRVERISSGSGGVLMLRGAPRFAGDMRFTVHTGEDDIVCTMSVTPAVPTLRVSGDISCAPGEEVELVVTAKTGDEGTLSYQWFAVVGPYSEAITDAVRPSFRPDTSEVGTVRYCCEVTNTNNGLTETAMSEPITVEVRERAIQSVSIESLPNKTDYLVGEELDVTGLRILVRYEGGYNEIRDTGFNVTPILLERAGTQSVVVSFEGRRCGFEVTVKSAAQAVSGIGVLTLPRKTEYAPGEKLQTAGLSVRAYTEDGGHFDVAEEELECSPTRLDREGEQVITVRYAERTCTFTVTVKAEKVVTGISVLTMPKTTTYTVGDRLDTTGLSIRVNSNKGAEPLTEGFTVTPKVLATVGTQEVTVIYGQYQTKFNVTVKARESVTPNPRASATPAPQSPEEPETSPAPSATARPVETPPMRKNTGVNTAVKVVFAIAVLALAGLAGYVWYLRKQGYGDDEPQESDEELHTVSGEPMDKDKK